MRKNRKAGRIEGWKNRKRDAEHSSFQTSILPSFQSFSRKAGFSLLEVLVALAIFAIAAGGTLVALGHHLKNVSFLQDHSRAVRIASREMNALRRMTTLSEEETEGDLPPCVDPVSKLGFDRSQLFEPPAIGQCWEV